MLIYLLSHVFFNQPFMQLASNASDDECYRHLASLIIRVSKRRTITQIDTGFTMSHRAYVCHESMIWCVLTGQLQLHQYLGASEAGFPILQEPPILHKFHMEKRLTITHSIRIVAQASTVPGSLCTWLALSAGQGHKWSHLRQYNKDPLFSTTLPYPKLLRLHPFHQGNLCKCPKENLHMRFLHPHLRVDDVKLARTTYKLQFICEIAYSFSCMHIL